MSSAPVSDFVVFSPTYFPSSVGGGERLAQLTAAGVTAMGEHVAIVTTGSDAGEYLHDGIPVHVVRRSADGESADLSQVFRRLRPRVVHMVGAWDSTAVVTAARNVGAVVGAAGLDYGQFCDNHRLVRGNGQVCSGRRSAADCFSCVLERERPRDRLLARAGPWLPDAMIRGTQRTGQAILDRPVVRQLDWSRTFAERDRARLAAAGALDLFVAPTRFAEEQTRPHLGSRTRCERLMYPVADQLLHHEPKRTPADQLVVGFVGRCLHMKGLHVLAAAVRALEGRVRVTLRVAAATNEAEEADYWRPLREQLRSRSNVIWQECGVLDSTDLRAFHAEVDVLAVPSLWPEYVGFVTLEALALGTPVVLSAFPPQRELLLDDASGSLVTPDDAAALTRALEHRWDVKRSGELSAVQTPALPASTYGRQLSALYRALGPADE